MPELLDSAAILRITLLASGQGFPVFPSASGGLKLSLEVSDEAFYGRLKLPGSLLFGGPDDPEAWRILHGIDNSRDRCQPLYILLETRPHGQEWKVAYRGTFTCNECKFNELDCTVEVTPTPDDGYRDVLENWEKEFNILAYATPANRRPVTAQLQTLSAGVKMEFLRIDRDEESDIVGTDGWTIFARDTSWIRNVGRSRSIYVFRYRQDNVPMVPVPGTSEYTPVDKSQQGYEPLFETQDLSKNPATISYVKSPEISGFPRGGYVIGTYNDWFRKYGDQLLVLNCGHTPPNPEGYVQLTGPGGAFNEECKPCVNLRRSRNDTNCKSIWWKFGQFRFTRGFPLLDAIYGLLQSTLAGTSSADLLPPTAQQLSDFFSLPVNPATGASGFTNEIPGLLISAASDVKRFGASEPATRLLVSLKTVLDDVMNLYDVGWFIDPKTGWFRIEHRVYRESGQAVRMLDLPKEADASLPATYSYRTEQLPRVEELTIASALTEDLLNQVFYSKGEITYSGSCVNQREGQNKSTRSVSRLTGDVAAMVLSGDALPDSALVLLASATDGSLPDGNRKVAASELLKRYHRRNRVRAEGRIGSQLVRFDSVKRGKLQEGLSYTPCTLDGIDGNTSITTNLGGDARLDKATLDLTSGVVTLSVVLPTPDVASPGPVPLRRAHNASHSLAHG